MIHTDRVLSWTRDNELPTGGIRCRSGCDLAYPECTGYTISTLLDYGERDLAFRCANWLVSIQDASGGYCSMDGRLHTFDTAAIVEGLEAAYLTKEIIVYKTAAIKARLWLKTMRLGNGLYRAGPDLGSPQHCIRVNAILSDDPGNITINYMNRTHFIAYALEGYQRMGYAVEVKQVLSVLPLRPDGIIPFYWMEPERGDIIATAQMAILMIKAGMDASKLVEAVRGYVHPNGGVPQAPDDPSEKSWGAKFYLDMEYLLSSAEVRKEYMEGEL